MQVSSTCAFYCVRLSIANAMQGYSLVAIVIHTAYTQRERGKLTLIKQAAVVVEVSILESAS